MTGRGSPSRPTPSRQVSVRISVPDISSRIRALRVAFNTHTSQRVPFPSPQLRHTSVPPPATPTHRIPKESSAIPSRRSSLRPLLTRQDSAVSMPRTPDAEHPTADTTGLAQLTMPNNYDLSQQSLSSLASLGPAQHEISELLSKTIQDFEGLLNEALSLARQAATIGEGENVRPMTMTNDARILARQPDASRPSYSNTAPAPPRMAFPESPSNSPRQQRDQPIGTPGDSTSPSGLHTDQFSPQEAAARDFAYPSAQGEPIARDTTQLGKFEIPEMPSSARLSLSEQLEHVHRRQARQQARLSKPEIKDYIKSQERIAIQRRSSPRGVFHSDGFARRRANRKAWRNAGVDLFRESPEVEDDFDGGRSISFGNQSEKSRRMSVREVNYSIEGNGLDLHNTRHVDLGTDESGIMFTHYHQPVARDWHNHRKRYVATVACLNTALLGLIVGIYAGEVPAIQYVIVDLHHWVIQGNTFLYLGLAIPTLLFWPLPLLHGRKTYTVAAMAVALPLQIPQGIAVGAIRLPSFARYRVVLLLCRGLSGFALGFAAINFMTTLLDLFGASLMSANPHQELVFGDDVRRHGGGMGLWLGWWSWCTIGSVSIGFLIGAAIVDATNVSWGFWVSIFSLMVVMFINIVTPEVRRSAYRRTVAEVIRKDGDEAKRVARGEVKMHLINRGPLWWGEEVKAGLQLSWQMLKQPGFLILAIYLGWVQAQFNLVLMLLGALMSNHYRFRPIDVGLCVLSLAIGAFLAIPFQKASYFSRARHHPQRTDSMTFEKRLTMSSHLIRRTIFTTLLPLAAAGYTLTASGPPLSPAWPPILAALVAFLSNLAIAEGTGLIMETFDVSDLQEGLRGHGRGRRGKHMYGQATDFSCHPRVTAGLMLAQGFAFLLCAGSYATCGGAVRTLGARLAIGAVAAILMGLTLLLTAALVRFKAVRMIPPRLERSLRASIAAAASNEQGEGGGGGEAALQRKETAWEPIIIGNPSGMHRRVSLLETGTLSRWMEIRRRNRIVEESV